MSRRWDIYREIQSLDPARDHQRVMHLVAGWEFPWEVERSLEIALHRTFCVPAISELLDRVGEFAHRAQRRHDDTGLLLTEPIQHGYDSERGRAAIARINRIHSRFSIANEDYLFVLSTFHFEPVRWIARFGWRPLCPIEVESSFRFWREVGRRMGIRDLPESNAAFAAFVRDYERRRFAYADANRRLGAAAQKLLASWVPRPLGRVVRAVLPALLERPVREALGMPRPSPLVRDLVAGALDARAALVRRMPPRRAAWFLTAGPIPTYPHGYEIARLGPPDLEPDRPAPFPAAQAPNCSK
ncbi:MAG: DUF2236 domain-containing protein [Planctomycetes bacterium]|nr:DUF2236 domain-containing protein [Planctomycetota bacterium]